MAHCPVANLRRAIVLGAAVLTLAPPLAAAAAEARSDAKPVRSMLDFRNDRLVRQHWDYSCGAATVATLLTYQLNAPVTERQAAVGMLRNSNIALVRARLGFSLLDLKHFAATRGFAASGYVGLTVDELVQMAPAIAPIIVLGFPHFVVVRGRRGDRLLLGDPAFGNRTMTVQAFDKAWPSRIGFVIYPPGDPHPPNRMGAPGELFISPTDSMVRAADADLRRVGPAQ